MTKIVILGNYQKTKQHSIRLYTAMLQECAEAVPDVEVRLWTQKGLFGRMRFLERFGRWPIDLDKYLVAPIEAMRIKTDVLYIADNSNAWYSFFIRKKALAVTCHDMIAHLCSEGRVAGWTPGLITRFFMRANILAMRKADKVISVSQTTAAVLQEVGVTNTVEVIPNCIVQDFPPAVSIEDIPDLSDHEAFFHMGAGKYTKNSEAVVGAFDILADAYPNRKLVLVLVGPKASKLRSLSRYPEKVFAHRSLEAGQIRTLYTQSLALLMPSRYEGFGLPILEANSLGCPVVASDGGALNEVMFDGPSKLRSPVDSNSLAHVMIRLIEDPTMVRDLVDLGYRNLKRFGVEDTKRSYTAALSQLCATLPHTNKHSVNS